MNFKTVKRIALALAMLICLTSVLTSCGVNPIKSTEEEAAVIGTIGKYEVKYEELRYSDIINRNLKVIDFTAATMCMENNVPTLAFGLNEENSIVRAVCDEELGTIIKV